MPLIGVTTCHKLEDYNQSIQHTGGEARVLEPSRAWTPRSTASRACC